MDMKVVGEVLAISLTWSVSSSNRYSKTSNSEAEMFSHVANNHG